MEFLAQYGLFALKTFTLVIAIFLLAAGLFSLGRKPKPKLEMNCLNHQVKETKNQILKEITGKKAPREKKKQPDIAKQPKLFVIDFQGDIKASQVDQLRAEISAVLSVAQAEDEVVIRIESPGGAVSGYGLAASQLQRIRDKKLSLTVCIDKIAASGGYLMACVANRIVAAPFAVIGSIGVVAQIPNFHRWLKKNDIDVELLTAGEYKRTLTLFAENTDKGRQKFQEDLEKVHHAFRRYVLMNRQQLDIDQVSTGEYWLAQDAFELRLVDAIKTSDAYLNDKMKTHQAYQIKIHEKQSLANKLLKPAVELLHPWGGIV